jgi:hypothetical protein
MVGTSNQSVPEMAVDMMVNLSNPTGDCQDDGDACEALCHAIDVWMPISMGHGTVDGHGGRSIELGHPTVRY